MESEKSILELSQEYNNGNGKINKQLFFKYKVEEHGYM